MSERVLVDTDVTSFVFKGHSRADEYAGLFDGKQIVVSFMTVAELKRWATKNRWGANRIAKPDQAGHRVSCGFESASAVGLGNDSG